MAYTIQWIDGFDEINNIDQKYAASDRSGSMATDHTPTAYGYGRSLRLQNGWVGPTLSGAPFTVLFTAFDLRLHKSFDVNDRLYFEFRDELATQNQVDLRLRVNNVTLAYDVVLRRGTTDIHTWPSALGHDKWQHVSIKFHVDPAAGSVELAVDGVSLGAFSGNTRNTVNTRVDRVRLYMIYNDDRIGIDNWIIAGGLTSDPLLPPSRVYGAVVPNANIAVAWTPSTGSNWQTVDEIPPSDSDYNSTTTAGAQDVFSNAAISSVGSQVLAVRANARSSTSTSDQIQNLVRVGGTDYYGATKTPTSSYFSYGHIWQDNPATSAPWTPSDAINAGFGYRRV